MSPTLKRCDVCGEERPETDFLKNPRLTRAVCVAHSQLRCDVCKRESTAAVFSTFLNQANEYDWLFTKDLDVPQRATLWHRLTQPAYKIHQHVDFPGSYIEPTRSFGRQRCDVCVNQTTCERCRKIFQPFARSHYVKRPNDNDATIIDLHHYIMLATFLAGRLPAFLKTTLPPDVPRLCDSCARLQPLTADELATVAALTKSRP